MSLQIIFEDSPANCESATYIERQPEWQRETLRQFVDELLKHRKIQHGNARKLEGDRWSLWVRHENGEAVNHICFFARADESIVSDFARRLLDPSPLPSRKGQPTVKRLMILTEDRGAVSIGKAEPYLDPEYYASLMDSIQRNVFLETVNDITSGRQTKDFTVHSDGTIAIHIERPHLAFGVHITCTATWV